MEPKVLKAFSQRGKGWEQNEKREIQAGGVQNAEQGKCELVNYQRYFEIPVKHSILGEGIPQMASRLATDDIIMKANQRRRM